MSLRLSTVILPYRRWHEGGRAAWERAEQLGFHTAYTYDHLSWRSFRDGPWFGAVPTLTAAASVAQRFVQRPSSLTMRQATDFQQYR
jgi:alkanesulfonate monooxygenase SsuD/methylene tetrahydromethanopterin reductase-like flavin-dependent oxidoreductase (luciferase family)